MLPAPFNTLSFWKALTFAVAGLLALLGYLDVVPDQFVYSADVLLAFVLTVLNFLHIELEQEVRQAAANLKRTQKLLEEASVLRNDLLGAKMSEKSAKRTR